MKLIWRKDLKVLKCILDLPYKELLAYHQE